MHPKSGLAYQRHEISYGPIHTILLIIDANTVQYRLQNIPYKSAALSRIKFVVLGAQTGTYLSFMATTNLPWLRWKVQCPNVTARVFMRQLRPTPYRLWMVEWHFFPCKLRTCPRWYILKLVISLVLAPCIPSRQINAYEDFFVQSAFLQRKPAV